MSYINVKYNKFFTKGDINGNTQRYRTFSCKKVPSDYMVKVSQRNKGIRSDTGGRQDRCLYFGMKGFNADGDVHETSAAIFKDTI